MAKWRTRDSGPQMALCGRPASLTGEFATWRAQRGELALPYPRLQCPGGVLSPREAGMGYRHLRACVLDLERHGHLRRIEAEIDPYLEMAEIHRRVYQAGGPALYFARVKGCAFPMVSNLFGTPQRTRFLFRDTLDSVRRLVQLK